MPYRESSAPLDLVFTVFNGTVQARERETGQVRWQQTSRNFLSSMVLRTDGERLYALSAGVLSALEAGTGASLWHVVVPLELTAKPPQLELLRDTLLIRHEGMLYAHSTRDGSLRWQTRAADLAFLQQS